MKKVSLFYLLIICIHLKLFSIVLPDLPDYNGTGPQNVYYGTGAGKWLLTEGGRIWTNQDNWSAPYRALCKVYEKKGYKFFSAIPKNLDDNFRKNVCAIYMHDMPDIGYCRRLGSLLEKVVVIMTEPPHIIADNYDPQRQKFFKRVLTWDDRLVDNKKFFKYHFVQSQLTMIDDVVPFEEKKLCTFIGSNKNSHHRDELYSKRREAIQFFERVASHDFDFYGHGWNSHQYSSYRGKVKSKTETLKRYKFSICYENIANQPGYITEKIFGSMIAGCVPIYWGADNITDYVPENCFIDKREFPNYKDLYLYISQMSEEEYNQYLQNIRDFLASPTTQKFSTDHFVKTLMGLQTQLN